jgi:nucleoside-diphosphate-sugar epimerase
MKIFVTGATGYIGNVVVEHAVRAGHNVEGLVRDNNKAGKLSQLGAKLVFGDLQSFEVLSAAASRADAVLHLAYIHDFTMDYEEVLRIDAAAVDTSIAGRTPQSLFRMTCRERSKPVRK